jgi:hypothetical protein
MHIAIILLLHIIIMALLNALYGDVFQDHIVMVQVNAMNAMINAKDVMLVL